MTALSATPLPDVAAIRLDITGAPVSALAPEDTPEPIIVRVDANGSRRVRLRQYQQPSGAPGAGVLTVTDYEAALVGPVRYDFTDLDGVTTSTSTSLDGLVALPQLHPAAFPQHRAELRAVTGYTATRSTTGTLHTIIGRTDPVARLGALALRRGQLQIWAADFATAATVEDCAALGEVLCLRQPTHPGMDMYWVAQAVTVEPDAHRWKVTAEFVEVAFPTAYLAGDAGWTFAELLAAGGTFAELPGEWGTFGAMAVGP